MNIYFLNSYSVPDIVFYVRGERSIRIHPMFKLLRILKMITKNGLFSKPF